MLPVQPDQKDGGADEVQRDVGDPERRRQPGHRVRGPLHRALSEHMQVPLERDDCVCVGSRACEGRMALPAHDLVDAVKTEDRRQLHETAVGGGREVPERGETMEGYRVHVFEATPAASAWQCG
jgi:hypothetical protein